MNKRLLKRTIMLFILLVGVWHILSFGFCIQDDTYIGLRYSRNLAEGKGLVFNPGERVEGYTNFLWVVLGTIPFIAGIDPVLFIRVLGVLAAVLAALAVGKLAGRISVDRKYSEHVAAFIFICLPFAMGEAAMGLETLLFSFFVVCAFGSYIIETRDNTRRGVVSGVFLSLSYLTRPEGLAVGFFLLIIDIFRWRKIANAELLKKQLRNRWLLFGSVALAHELFRFFYYGDFVPNTYRAKVRAGGGYF